MAVDLYKEFKHRFNAYSDLELVKAFNGQVKNPGSGSAKMAYLSALRHEFEERNIDVTSISTVVGETYSISYQNRVALYVLDCVKFIRPI